MRKSVLITGASRGIGRETARVFAQAGYDLYLVCQKRRDLLTALAQELTASHAVSCAVFEGDIGQPAFVEELFLQLPHLHVLINNAALSHIGLIQDMTYEEWDRIVATNLNAVFYCCKHAVPMMLQAGGGHIINVSSVWGNVGASMEVAYSATKGGVNAFTKALAKELAPNQIQVNAAAFGIIDTQMNAHLSPDELLQLVHEIPANRLGSPLEAARLLLSLAQSPSYLTGQIITMDGGWT